MTTLAADSARTFELGDIGAYPVVATDILYEGSAIGDNGSGYARPLVSGDPFRGFCEAKVDNSAGSAGDKYARVVKRGLIKLAVASLAITDVGRPVYASDDDTFNLTGIGSFIGHVDRYVSSGVGVVRFDASRPEDEIIVSLPITLANLSNADVLTTYTPGFAGRVKKMSFAVTTAVTTGSKAATLNAEIGTTNLTGGALALTSANCTPLGAVVDATAITAAAGFTATDTLSIEASSVTTFVEGAGVLLITLGR